jgi:hypothetical protein
MVSDSTKLPWYALRRKMLAPILFWTLLPYSLVVVGLFRLVCSRPRFTLRTFLVGAALAGLTVAYFVSYYALSRRGMHEAATTGLMGFFYVPFAQVNSPQDLTVQRRLTIFYAPANALDRALFQSPSPVQNITWLDRAGR